MLNDLLQAWGLTLGIELVKDAVAYLQLMSESEIIFAYGSLMSAHGMKSALVSLSILFSSS